MSNKKRVKNNFKQIYEKVNHNKYSQLTNVSGKVQVKSNLTNLIKNYKTILILIIVILLGLFIYTFRQTPMTILYCVLFLLGLFAFYLYVGTYRLTLDEKNLNLYINFQKTTIDTNSLANIYVSRQKMHFFGFPIYNYLLNIIYMKDNEPMIITLPTVMIDRKNLLKLFSNIKTVKIKDEEEEKQEKRKK